MSRKINTNKGNECENERESQITEMNKKTNRNKVSV